ncbi:MAG: GNAT family N-acetyltransferase [Clostridiales bacterium]|jgi:predicted GNAT family N-acyltransferase|nr:GNAT family N-acetyltransferase [Clostridiales bacterium]
MKTIVKIQQLPLDDMMSLRHDVFVVEQNVPIEEELCDDESLFVHIGLYINSAIVAYCRLLIDTDTVHIGRVSVSKSMRRQGMGRQIMNIAHDYAKDVGCKISKLSAQLHALDFYLNLNYVSYGDQYMDAGIPHISMLKYLTPNNLTY